MVRTAFNRYFYNDKYPLTGEQEVLPAQKPKNHLKIAVAMQVLSNRNSKQGSSNKVFPKQGS